MYGRFCQEHAGRPLRSHNRLGDLFVDILLFNESQKLADSSCDVQLEKHIPKATMDAYVGRQGSFPK